MAEKSKRQRERGAWSRWEKTKGTELARLMRLNPNTHWLALFEAYTAGLAAGRRIERTRKPRKEGR